MLADIIRNFNALRRNEKVPLLATIPPFEKILLQFHQSLCGSLYPTKKKRNFVTGQTSLDSQWDMTGEILDGIFTALKLENIDDLALDDAKLHILNMANAYKEVELNTWTFEADARQITWDMLGYFFTPGAARIIANWNLPEPLDKDMPSGRFWYLPEPDEGKDSKLKMPVAQVVGWLRDLLGMSWEGFAEERAGKLNERKDSVYESMIRSLYKWENGTLPDLYSIDLYFPDKMDVNYRGVFQLGAITDPEVRFKAALEFVEKRGLTPETLQIEINISDPDRIKRIMAGDTDAEQRAEFVEELANRYAPPLPSTIRQRLRIARTVQEGYTRLLKSLCPEVDTDCADPDKNKLLQIFTLFKRIYNLTTEASVQKGHMGEQAENEWFEDKLLETRIDPELFLLILPSQRETANRALGTILSRRFQNGNFDGKLPDLMPAGNIESIDEHSKTLKKTLEERHDDQVRFETLMNDLLSGDPDKALASEDRYDILFDALRNPDLPFEIHNRLFERIFGLHLAPWQTMQAVLFRLETMIENNAPKELVESIIEKSKLLPGYDALKAQFLYNEGRHRIRCNDFEGAIKCLREASNDCLTRSYGSLRGTIAKDLFALEVANQKLITANHEKHYRDMLNFYSFESEEILSFEDMAAHVSEYFWAELYKPYQGIPPLEPALNEDLEKLLGPILEHALEGDTQGLARWLKKNKRLLKKPLRYIRGDTVLIGLINAWDMIKKGIDQLPYMMQMQLRRSFRDTISTISTEAPQLLAMADFKSQTPLMLVAEQGDAKLVEIMIAAGADPAAQDCRGKTALHAAIVKGHKAVIEILLKHPECVTKETVLGETPAHSAALAGDADILEKLLSISPALANAPSIHGTPLERAEAFLKPDVRREFSHFAKQNGAKIADEHEIRACISILKQYTSA
ncbi:ankyrin repeat domain-containing protein [Profundibacter sp.]